MKSLIVDTNVFLRFLLNDIPKQKKLSETLLTQAKGGKVVLVVAQIVIFEIDFILEKHYQFSKEEVIEKLASLVSIDYLQIESKDIFLEALRLYKTTSVSFVDCFLLAKAAIEEAELFTFDKKLGNRDKSV